jgi:holo-[acyl-carrier protein] synthase
MIVGTGVDIVEVKRIEKIYTRFQQRFAQRILHPDEWQDFENHPHPIRFLAKRFAAKEACTKAFGTGFSQGLAFMHIAIGHDDLGKPILIFDKMATIMAANLTVSQTHLSLSDENKYVVAMVILEK